MLYTQDDCEKLAWQIVDSMEMDDIRRNLAEELEEQFVQNPDAYEESFKIYNGDDDVT